MVTRKRLRSILTALGLYLGAADLKQSRAYWERRLALLRPTSIDPDMLDERTRALLGYVHPHDVVMPVKRD
jgi:cell division protein FtsB